MHTHLNVTVFFRLLASSKLGMQNCKVSRDLNPPIESKLSRDNLDSIGGFKSRDTLQFCIPSLDEASNLKNTVYKSYNSIPGISSNLTVYSSVHHQLGIQAKILFDFYMTKLTLYQP